MSAAKVNYISAKETKCSGWMFGLLNISSNGGLWNHPVNAASVFVDSGSELPAGFAFILQTTGTRKEVSYVSGTTSITFLHLVLFFGDMTDSI